MEPKTLEDFKALVKDLKSKLDKVDKKNAELTTLLNDPTPNRTELKKRAEIEHSILMHSKAEKITAIWRGFYQRRLFKKMIRKLARADFKSPVRSTAKAAPLLDILSAAKKNGLNLEILYRMCDQEGQGSTTIEEWKLLFKKLKLKDISQVQISKFLHMIDQEVTGVVAKGDYLQLLFDNGVNSEPYNGRTKGNSYERECLLKFARVLKARDVLPEEVYSFCDIKGTGIVSTSQLAKFIKNLSEPFEEKEILGLIQYLGKDNNKRIPKDFFIQELVQAMREIRTTKNVIIKNVKSPNRLDSLKDKKREEQDPYVSKKKPQEEEEEDQQTTLRKTLQASSGFRRKDQIDHNDNSEENNTLNRTGKSIKTPNRSKLSSEKKELTPAELATLKKIIQKMEKQSKKPIYQFLERFLLSVKDPKKGLTEPEILRQLDKDYGNTLNREERLSLVSALDYDQNGDIDVFEVKRFFLFLVHQTKERVVSPKLLLIIMARMIEAEKIPTEEFFKKKGLNRGERSTLQDFHKKVVPYFEFREFEASELFTRLDEKREGTVEVGYLIDTVDSFRGDRKLPAAIINPTSLEVPQFDQEIIEGGDQAMVVSKVQATVPKKKVEKIENKARLPQAVESNDKVRTFKKAIVKLELENLPIYLHLEDILRDMDDPGEGIPIHLIQETWERGQVGKVLTPEEVGVLIQTISPANYDKINTDDIRVFINQAYRVSKERLARTETILLIIAKFAEGHGLPVEDYLGNLGLQVKRNHIPLVEVIRRIAPLMTTPEHFEEEVFGPLDFEKSGYVNMGNLVRNVTKLAVKTHTIFKAQAPTSKLTSPKGQDKEKKATIPVIPTPTEQQVVVIKPFVVDKDKEAIAKQARELDEAMIDAFKDMVRQADIEPLEFFELASQGDNECETRDFRETFQKARFKISPQDIAKLLKLFDVDQTGTIELRNYEMVIADEEYIEFLKENERLFSEEEDVNEQVVEKLQKLLGEMRIEPLKLFKECGASGAVKEITIVQLREGMKRVLPYSRISYSDTIKLMRTFDRNCTGIITEEVFTSIMYRVKPGANMTPATTGVIKEIIDPRAELMSAVKIQNFEGGGKEGNNDLKDALQKLKSVIYNARYFQRPDEVFRQFDLDNDRCLSREEFLKALDSLDSKISLTQRQKVLLVHQADRHRINKVNYDDFLQLLYQINTGPPKLERKPDDFRNTRYPVGVRPLNQY